jgi:hypothetical protein
MFFPTTVSDTFIWIRNVNTVPITVVRLTVVDGRGILRISSFLPTSELPTFESMLFLSDSESARLREFTSDFSFAKTTIKNNC